MGILTYKHIPLVSSTKGNVAPGAAIAAGSSAYGTATTAIATKWILGSDIPKGRKLFCVVNTGAIANTPTAFKVSLWGGGTTTSGGSAAEIASTVNEVLTPPGGTAYTFEFDQAVISDTTKYYSAAITVNGASSAATLIADATLLTLDPTYLP